MRVEEQGMPVTVIKPEVDSRVAQRRGDRPEVTLQDLKVQPEAKAVDERDTVPNDEKVKSAVQTANKLMSISSYHMQFKIDDHSERLQVILIDDSSQQVIRQIPADKMLELSARIKEVLDNFTKMVGVFVDEIG